MKKPTLGDDVPIDVDRLLVSRLLVQANSGGGKSYALRRLLEQTFGHCQHIVLDPEGEFHTLREKYDYVLAGKGGEAAATVETAELLAHRLLELGVSAIVDISELGRDRIWFVTRFLEALVGAPRELWHSVLVVLDEAHRYCPEGIKASTRSERERRRKHPDERNLEDSVAAVVTLMDSGRKRGFCGVLATQRLSKLSKDATAECNNKLIGRCVEVDARRAADELGLSSRDAVQQLRKLRAGEFFAFGPALSDDVRLVKVGPVQTTHPEAGQAAPPPTPPRAKVLEVLGRLQDLPKEAAEEARTSSQLRQRVRELEREIDLIQKGFLEAQRMREPKIVEKVVEKMVPDPRQLDLLEWIDARLLEVRGSIDHERRRAAAPEPAPRKTLTPAAKERLAKKVDESVRAFVERGQAAQAAVDRELAKAESPIATAPRVDAQTLLRSLTALEAVGLPLSIESLAAWIGVHPKTKSLLAGVGALRADGLLDGWNVTPEGRAVTGAIEVLSVAVQRERLCRALSEQQIRILDTVATFDHAITHSVLAAWMGLHPKTKSLLEDLGKLRAKGYLRAKGLQLTEVGARASTGRGLSHEHVLSALSDGQRRIAEIVLKEGEVSTVTALAEQLGVHPKTKSLLEDLGKLRERGLAAKGWPLRLTDVFQGAA